MKNKTMRIAALLLALTLMTSCFVGGTFAKYTSEHNATDSARVALWKFTVGDSNTVLANNFTFNLFDTVGDTNDADSDGNDDDVKDGSDETIIAPGTTGSFALNLSNASDVNATYAIDWTITNTSNIPLEYKVDNGDWSSDLTDITATAINMNAGVTVTVYWRWAFETANGDAADTALGTAGTATVTVAAKVTVTQVD